MSSSNHRRNKAFIDKYRKELKSMLDDISEIDTKVLNRAVNEGVKVAKNLTSVGEGGNVVDFYTRDGTHVNFKTKQSRVGGFMRKSWHTTPTVKTKGKGVSKSIVNSADYASYVNYGHVIKNSKNGPIKGFVKGQFILEKASGKVYKVLVKEFEKEVERVGRKHDK